MALKKMNQCNAKPGHNEMYEDSRIHCCRCLIFINFSVVCTLELNSGQLSKPGVTLVANDMGVSPREIQREVRDKDVTEELLH